MLELQRGKVSVWRTAGERQKLGVYSNSIDEKLKSDVKDAQDVGGVELAFEVIVADS